VRNLRLILSYDGADFAGWQVQPGRTTVQGALASAIGRLSGENVLPQGSGRTDAGVHALAQVASFATASTIPVGNWLRALNDILPASIRVLEVSEATPEFHARKSARAKTYRYRICRGAICPPFLARYVWHYPYPLEESAMLAAAGVVLGEHDFTSFAAVDPERVERMAADENMGTGNSGLRITMRTDDLLVHLGARGRRTNLYGPRQRISSSHGAQPGRYISAGREGNGEPGRLRRILEARERSAAGPTAPASGLYLVEVEY
jgi:tRNA pseudouridine38-40 synthase